MDVGRGVVGAARPSSPRCAGCWRRGDSRRGGSGRPRCRGSARAPRRGARSSGGRRAPPLPLAGRALDRRSSGVGVVGIESRARREARCISRRRISGFSRVLPRAPHPYPSPQGGGGSPEREHRIDKIVPRALLAEMDLQAVGEEGEEVATMLQAEVRQTSLAVADSIMHPADQSSSALERILRDPASALQSQCLSACNLRKYRGTSYSP